MYPAATSRVIAADTPCTLRLAERLFNVNLPVMSPLKPMSAPLHSRSIAIILSVVRTRGHYYLSKASSRPIWMPVLALGRAAFCRSLLVVLLSRPAGALLYWPAGRGCLPLCWAAPWCSVGCCGEQHR